MDVAAGEGDVITRSFIECIFASYGHRQKRYFDNKGAEMASIWRSRRRSHLRGQEAVAEPLQRVLGGGGGEGRPPAHLHRRRAEEARLYTE